MKKVLMYLLLTLVLMSSAFSITIQKDIGSYFGEGFDNRVTFCGIDKEGNSVLGTATCTGDWFIDPCTYESSCGGATNDWKDTSFIINPDRSICDPWAICGVQDPSIQDPETIHKVEFKVYADEQPVDDVRILLRGGGEAQNSYYKVLNTDGNGYVSFDDVIDSWEYTYFVSKDGYHSQQVDNILIDSDRLFIINLESSTTHSPVINLADVVNQDYTKPVIVCMDDVTTDADSDELSFSAMKISGSSAVTVRTDSYDSDCFIIESTLTNQEAVVRFTATDESGNNDNHNLQVNFISNSAPVVNSFTITPQSGKAPLEVTFDYQVSGEEGEGLVCGITTGDGHPLIADNCDNLHNWKHTYEEVGTYTASLVVSDQILNSEPVEKIVVVTPESSEFIKITDFNLLNTELTIPQDLSFKLGAEHTEGKEIECLLYINDFETPWETPCNTDNFVVENYNKDGEGTFSFVVREVENTANQVTETKTWIFDGSSNEMPTIVKFATNPTTPYAGELVRFDLEVKDPEGDKIYCALSEDINNFENNWKNYPCDEIDQELAVKYSKAGVYTLRVEATDRVFSDEYPSTQKLLDLTVIENQPPVVAFGVHENSAVNRLETSISFVYNDPEGETLSCELDLAQGAGFEKIDCNKIGNKVVVYDKVGTYDLKVRVKDSVNTVEKTTRVYVTDNSAPDVTFDANPKTGSETLTTTLTFQAADNEGDSLTCQLDLGLGNGYQTTDCNSINNRQVTYNTIGQYTLGVKVSDGRITETRTTQVEVLANQAPTVTFSASPLIGYETLTTTLSFEATDVENDALTCRLNTGSGYQNINCDTIDQSSYSFNTVGTHTISVEVTDDKHAPIIRSIDVNVLSGTEGPIINNFDVISSNGLIVPTNISMSWNGSHSVSTVPIVCYLSIAGVEESVDCVGSRVINNYNTSGTVDFVFRVSDGLSDDVSLTRTFAFENEQDAELDLSKLALLIDDVIQPGEFDFTITVFEEKVNMRTLRVKPIIICDGTKNYLSDNYGYLTTSAQSTQDSNQKSFKFTTNTRDFILKVPTDKQCRFEAHLVDQYGNSVVLVDSIMFKYAVENTTYKSIRGKGADITDYMSSTMLSGSIKTGYNSIDFVIANNEGFAKEMDISLVSASLGIEHREDISLAPGQSRRIQIPIFIDPELESGMYPVRLSVRDGLDKQVKISYINVGK